ncbi:retrovirus-related pol polyprotein from transposon TNT 1-94 [Tanacetum coccineum]
MLTTDLEQDNLSPNPLSQENVPPVDETITMLLNELDMLLSLTFDEYFNGATLVVLKSSTVPTADASDKRQQPNTTPSTLTTVAADTTQLDIQTTPEPTNQAPFATTTEDIDQAENVMVDEDEFVNIFSTPAHENKCDKENTLICNKARLVAKGYSQAEGIDFEELFRPVAWLKQSGYLLHQHHPDKVYCLKKALYGLKQAPRAWYNEISNFLVSKAFSKGSIDLTLFLTKHEEDILPVQIYVDDITFGSKNPRLSKKFEKLMHIKFEISMMRELKFFLGIQIYQSLRGIFINHAKYTQEILKKHGMTSCDSIGTPIATKPLDGDLSGTPINQTKYYQLTITSKRLNGSFGTLRIPFTWDSGIRRTDFELTAFSEEHWYPKDTAEAEYVSLSACCAQVLWMKTWLTDYGYHFDKIPMYYDSKAAIAILCNPVQHSCTKHIDVRYHFIKEHVERVLYKYSLSELNTS